MINGPRRSRIGPKLTEIRASKVGKTRKTPGFPGHRSHTVSNWLHNLSWFIICDREGSVSTGLIQGLKAVLLFAGSSVAFCHRQESQCMTKHKVTATAIVTLGTALYYLAPNVSAADLAAQREADAGKADAGQYELVPKPSPGAGARSPLHGEEGDWE